MHTDRCLVVQKVLDKSFRMNEAEFELEVKNKASLMRRGRKDIPDYRKERKGKYMDMGSLCRK